MKEHALTHMKEKLVKGGITQGKLREKIKSTKGDEQIRYRVMLALLMGKSVAEIGSNLNITKSRIYKWTENLLKFGYKGLYPGPGEIRPRRDCPKNWYKHVTARLTKSEYDKLSQYAKDKNLFLSECLRSAVKGFPRDNNPKSTSKQPIFRISTDQFENLKKFAKASDTDVPHLVRMIISDFLNDVPIHTILSPTETLKKIERKLEDLVIPKKPSVSKKEIIDPCIDICLESLDLFMKGQSLMKADDLIGITEAVGQKLKEVLLKHLPEPAIPLLDPELELLPKPSPPDPLMDQVQNFLEDCTYPKKRGKISLELLYEVYGSWRRKGKYTHVLTPFDFENKITQLNIKTQEKKKKTWFKGIELDPGTVVLETKPIIL